MNHRYMVKNICFIPPILAALMLLSTTVLASTRASEAALSGNPLVMFDEGRRILLKGEKRVAKAEKQLREGREMLREGEELIEKGDANVLRSRDSYAAHSRSRGLAVEPDAVEKESKRLKEISEDWEDALRDIRKGRKLEKKGQKKISSAQDDLREANALVDRGNTLIRNSELALQGEQVVDPTP